jgi:signal transduction histidine kinase
VRVSLRQEDLFGTRLTIADDGVGLNGDATSSGFGLTSMRERVAASNGSLVLESHPSGGTTVEARWPAQTVLRRKRSSVS